MADNLPLYREGNGELPGWPLHLLLDGADVTIEPVQWHAEPERVMNL